MAFPDIDFLVARIRRTLRDYYVPDLLTSERADIIIILEHAKEMREAMQHTLAMGHLTPGGSQEGWYKRLLGEEIA